ncbi:MAG: HlyD family efflux transporter periplasmic adaptor subunit [Acidobacteria bacterium]|nr:HlyD family efflux transporter periplasmic adaptor subunit [Acidobacteriota bacterium]
MRFYRQPVSVFQQCGFGRFILIAAAAAVLAASPACSRMYDSPEPIRQTAKNFSRETSADPVHVAEEKDTESLRIVGAVQAVQSQRIIAPRLSAQTSGNMLATSIVSNGSRVRAGDVLVVFDSQTQTKNIQDRQAEYDGLVRQIQRKQADHVAALANDETELKGAELDVQSALMEMRKNDLIPQSQAKINTVNLAEAEAKYRQLQETLELKNEARAAELRILEIQRDRAKLAVDQAESNIEKMTLRSPMDGLVVLSQIRKGTRQVYPQAGDEFSSGRGIMTVVDTARMRVAAVLNQADISRVYTGQTTKVRLDAYPELVFNGTIEQISPIVTGTRRIRQFSITVSIEESHPNLLPDLTASVDLMLTPEAADD